MKKFSLDLIENSYAHFFSIDSRDNKTNIIKTKTGLLQRNFNQQWTSQAHELSSVKEAGEHLGRKLNLKGYDNILIKYPFHSGRVLKENRHILDYLQKLDVRDWKIVFRANHIQKFILKRGTKEKKNNFNHYSILIKVKPKENRHSIEVGEGNCIEPKFNQDGLKARLQEIMNNHKQKLPVNITGKVPIILSAGDGGILFHEILGHALEADYIFHNQSPIAIRDLGKPIMSENVKFISNDKNDPFFSGIKCDDDGETIKPTTLIEDGKLKNIISDSFYKHLLGIKTCGHSRQEDFTHLPMPRTFSLYLKPGTFYPEELIESTKYGIYAREFGEGKIYFEKNIFYFSIRDAKLVENGKPTAPLGNIMVKGSITEVLNSVDMVANDFRYDKGINYCFKNGQTLNVRVGQPTVKINNLFVSKDSND
jgi:predicted Zn-dependent protease